MSSVLNNILWILKINFQKLPFLSVLRILGFIHTFASTLLSSFVLALIVNWTTEYISSDTQNSSLIIYSLLAFAGYYLLNSFTNIASNYGENLSRIYLNSILPDQLLHQKLNSLSTSTLENPDVQNSINRYRDNKDIFNSASTNILSVLSLTIALIIASVPLISLIPFAAIVLILASIPNIWSNKLISSRLWFIEKDATVSFRKSGNIVDMITDPESLKEIRLLNAYSYLRKYFDDFMYLYFGKIRKTYSLWSFLDVLNALLKGSAILFALFQILELAFNLLGSNSPRLAAFVL